MKIRFSHVKFIGSLVQFHIGADLTRIGVMGVRKSSWQRRDHCAHPMFGDGVFIEYSEYDYFNAMYVLIIGCR